MNRRRFLWEGIGAGGIALGVGGFLFVHRSQARTALASNMLNDALPPLTATSSNELYALPVRARQEIKRYFHGKCLNVEGFVRHICSNDFSERLGRCRTQDERDCCFLDAFSSRVATDAEILNQVETIAADLGSELDSAWADYSNEVLGKWNTRIAGYGKPLTLDGLTKRLGAMIRTELTQAAHQAVSGNQRPSVGDTIDKIGESAVRLLPLATVKTSATLEASATLVGVKGGGTIRAEQNPLVLPVFFLLAARPVWDYFTARLDDRSGDYQAALSARLALLGNRVGAEFEREVRERVTDLHTWQERSVRATASHLAEERVGLLGGFT